jgi:hypothetical protein
MKYWHQLTDKEVGYLIESNVTWKDIMDSYRQPDWCGYPEAINGQMGCWSLTGEDRLNISRGYCKNCYAFIKDVDVTNSKK